MSSTTDDEAAPSEASFGASSSEVVQEFIETCREMSTATVLFHTAIAERLGLNPSDHKCADIVRTEGPMTAGRLAELSGLTTGAITGVIDRLEKAEFVAREPDPTDRRKVLVRYREECLPRIGHLFAGIATGTAELCARYDEDQLRLIIDFMRRATALTVEQAGQLKGATEKPSREKPSREKP